MLVIAIGRINKDDTYNNGLLLRNLFSNEWPRERLAQIYSSGDTEDDGFFGRYYKLGPNDRIFGDVFYRLKSSSSSKKNLNHEQANTTKNQHQFISGTWIKRQAMRFFVDTGLYELIFRPHPSKDLMKFVTEFQPDVIFAQGYNLTFSWLPLFLKNSTNAKLAVLTSDDWPNYLYTGMHGEPKYLKYLIHPIVKKAAHSLFTKADIHLAFGNPMAHEYERRYGKRFITINHTDDPNRFQNCMPKKTNDKSKFTIVAIGTFNKYRWPLLLDANEACAELNHTGCSVRISVLSSSIDLEGIRALENTEYIDVLPDPGNDELPCYLKGADALLLIEGFDDSFVSAIKLSISSKAHLFMLSKKPIIVYAASETGVATYAANYGWAEIVSNRSIINLTNKLRNTLTNQTTSDQLIKRAYEVALEYHTHTINQARFINALSNT